MPLKKKNDDYIPIKIEGWNGKFLYPPGATNNVSKVRAYNSNFTSASNFYGFNTEPIVLPPTWDGTFAKSGEVRIEPERNHSDNLLYFVPENGEEQQQQQQQRLAENSTNSSNFQ